MNQQFNISTKDIFKFIHENQDSLRIHVAINDGNVSNEETVFSMSYDRKKETYHRFITRSIAPTYIDELHQQKYVKYDHGDFVFNDTYQSNRKYYVRMFIDDRWVDPSFITNYIERMTKHRKAFGL